jgi:heme-degrading monooxygenase HmoA
MFIRGTRVQTPPEKVDDAIANFKKQVLPNAAKAPGYLGAALLVDRKSGAGIGITYWESAKALSNSEQMGIKTRTDAAQNVAGTQIVNVERYEIVIMERTAQPKADTFMRVNVLNADPDKVDALTGFSRDKALPTLKAIKGFRSLVVGVDRQTGRCAISTSWETLADLQASESKVTGLRQEVARTAGANGVEVEIFELPVIELVPAAVGAATR